MKRDVLNSPRLLELKKRRRRAVLSKIFIVLLGFLAVFSLLVFLARLDSLNISKIEILSSEMTNTEAVKKAVEEQIAGNYFWFFPKTNFIIYPQHKIETELKNKFKGIKDVFINDRNIKILEVSFNERIAKYTWCGAEPYLENEKCYFVDEDGYVFDEAPYFSGAVYFKFYGAQAESYFSKQKFKQLVDFKDFLLSFGLKPVMLYVADNGDVEIFLSKRTSSAAAAGPKIIFKLSADFQNVMENLEAALNTEPLKSKFKNKYSSLQYIDLRFGNKVYDKFSS